MVFTTMRIQVSVFWVVTPCKDTNVSENHTVVKMETARSS